MQTSNDVSRNRTVTVVACVVVGYILGVATFVFARPGVAATGQRAEVVVVVQTATPGAAVAAPVEPQAELASDVPLTATLSGARDSLRAGRADAPVQLVLFEDGQCPFCRQMSSEVIARVISEHVPNGNAAVNFRHYPFLGAESQALAVAMECAGRQDKFWPFHDLAFAEQRPENAGLVTPEALAGWAVQVGLDADAFAACQGDAAVRDVVDADLQLGRSLGVRGTPTLFVNGKRLVGAVPYAFVESSIEAALRAAPARP